jgi:formiminotetrahydrofolate cyclodeaminase
MIKSETSNAETKKGFPMSTATDLYNESFSRILELACSKSHVPGGGSVSAMSATLGASMGAMVANLTIDKKGYENAREEVAKILDYMTTGIEDIKKLTQDDMDAFDSLLSAYRMPKSSDEQKAARKEEIQKATVTASIVPLRISAASNNLLFHIKRLSAIGNGGVVNDCAVAAILLEGSVRAAMLSVDVNFANIADPAVKDEIKDKKEKILADAKFCLEETLNIVDSRDKTL